MNLEAERKLKFDRRLHTRQGWLSKEALQAELDALPDVSSKIDSQSEEVPNAETLEAEAPAPAAESQPEGVAEQAGPLLAATPGGQNS